MRTPLRKRTHAKFDFPSWIEVKNLKGSTAGYNLLYESTFKIVEIISYNTSTTANVYVKDTNIE